MNLALLGLDEQTREIVLAALVSSQHRVVAVCDVSAEQLESLRTLGVPRLQPLAWESLLADPTHDIDAVVVAAATADSADQTLRAEQLTRLVQAGVPLLISHPVLSSMLACYELEMVRTESRCVMVPFLPARWHPVIDQLIGLVQQGAGSPVGLVQQAVFERFAVERDRATVLAHFACDVDLIRRTCGDIARVGALGSMAEPAAYANLAVQLSGPDAVSTRWSIAPVDDTAGGRVTFFGEHGRLVLQMPDHAPWQLDVRPATGAQPQTICFPEWDASATALEKLTEAMLGRTAAGGGQASDAWNEAARDVELAETVDRSLLRGRTIEVHHEELSEAGTFKGLMTSVGCGLLLITIFLVFALEVAGKAARALRWQWLGAALQTWPLILLLVLVLFLVLQLLLKAAGPRGRDRGTQDG